MKLINIITISIIALAAITTSAPMNAEKQAAIDAKTAAHRANALRKQQIKLQKAADNKNGNTDMARRRQEMANRWKARALQAHNAKLAAKAVNDVQGADAQQRFEDATERHEARVDVHNAQKRLKPWYIH